MILPPNSTFNIQHSTFAMLSQFRWDAFPYFKSLVEKNRLAQSLDMKPLLASGLQGLEQAVDNLLDLTSFCIVTESADGRLNTDYTPNSKRVATVYLAVRHAENDVEAHKKIITELSEIFRQFMSHLIRERIRLSKLGIYLDPLVEFHEIPEYTFSGCAAMYFHISYSTAVNLVYNESEWD